MTLTKRSDKGQALTYEELDGNFTHLGGDGSYQFPATDGLADQVLATDGNGQLYFRDQIQRLSTDVVGSVFADDSTLLVDGTEGTIVGPINTSQLRTSERTVRLGYYAGANALENQSSVYIGSSAGIRSSNLDNIAIGTLAGEEGQGLSAIAIGNEASRFDQGDYSIAIGHKAGFSSITTQAFNTIVLNATGAALLAPTPNRFYVKPVREVTGGTPPAGFSPCYYNPTTGEVIVVSP